MKPLLMFRTGAALVLLTICAFAAARPADPPAEDKSGVVSVASLVYANDRSAVCFSDNFLSDLARKSNVRTNPKLQKVSAESQDLFQYPFTVMTGEKSFSLTDAQRKSLRDYLQGGGFIVASAGCSSKEWSASFRAEISRILPDQKLKPLDMSHPVFHTVYSINALSTKHHAAGPHLEALELDGRVALIFSPDGLNDTAHAGGTCCCCGGDEITNAGQVNVNLLAYALTH